jgi:hypothetical protein
MRSGALYDQSRLVTGSDRGGRKSRIQLTINAKIHVIDIQGL